MHTAHSLKSSMFRIEIADAPGNRESLLDWQLHDRLGVVVTTPLGGLGASMLIQLVITAYYDARPTRREAPHYAEIYVFHFGGRFGDHSSFDIAPPRREVFVEGDPAALIEALNDRAITHLAVPDAPIRSLLYRWSEEEALRDRVRRCYAYDRAGHVADADVTIHSADPAPRQDVELALDPQRMLAEIKAYMNEGSPALQAYTENLAEILQSRLYEVRENEREAARARCAAASGFGVAREAYRRIEVDDALGMLHR